MEGLGLQLIHCLRFCLSDLTVLLETYHLADGIHTSRSFRLVGIIGRHVDAALAHTLLPGNGMVRHGIIEHAIHVKEHDFGTKGLKAVFF